MKKIIIATAVLLTGCVVEAPPRVVYVQAPPPPPVDYQAPAPEPVVSVYVDPPLDQPPPIRVEWAPPPMLVETVAPMPYDGAIWIGGYWVWEGNWVWAHGRWAPPPRPGYGWCNPYYENRGGSVVFVNGFWAAPGVSFVAPSLSVNISLGVVAAGVIAGPRPIGPQGVFVPAPPGSHRGLIVPAPIGTAPAVVTSAPPIIHPGMRVNVNSNNTNTTINNISNVHNVTNITNVTIVAPPGTTANGQAVSTSVPAQPHLAAALPPVVKTMAPEPASSKPIPAYVPGRQPMALPPPQAVHAEVTPASMHPHAGEQVRSASPFNEMPAHPAATPYQGNQNQQNVGTMPQSPREQQDRFNREREQPPVVKLSPPNPPAPPAPMQQQGGAYEAPRQQVPAQQARPSEPPRPQAAAQQPRPAEKAEKPQEEKKPKGEGKPGERRDRE